MNDPETRHQRMALEIEQAVRRNSAACEILSNNPAAWPLVYDFARAFWALGFECGVDEVCKYLTNKLETTK